MLICIVLKLNGEIACLRRMEKVDFLGAPLLKILQMYLAIQFGRSALRPGVWGPILFQDVFFPL